MYNIILNKSIPSIKNYLIKYYLRSSSIFYMLMILHIKINLNIILINQEILIL